MKKKLAAEHIDFADSEYQYFKSENRDITVFLESWDAKQLRLLFTRVIHFLYQPGSGPAELFEIEDSPILQKIVDEYGGDPAEKFKLFF